MGTRESTSAVAAALDAEDFAAAGLAVRDTPAIELDDVLLLLAKRAESGPDLELQVKGFGETEQVEPNETNGEDNPEGRALNHA